jgi:hypothetical protein
MQHNLKVICREFKTQLVEAKTNMRGGGSGDTVPTPSWWTHCSLMDPHPGQYFPASFGLWLITMAGSLWEGHTSTFHSAGASYQHLTQSPSQSGIQSHHWGAEEPLHTPLAGSGLTNLNSKPEHNYMVRIYSSLQKPSSSLAIEPLSGYPRILSRGRQPMCSFMEWRNGK